MIGNAEVNICSVSDYLPDPRLNTFNLLTMILILRLNEIKIKDSLNKKNKNISPK